MGYFVDSCIVLWFALTVCVIICAVWDWLNNIQILKLLKKLKAAAAVPDICYYSVTFDYDGKINNIFEIKKSDKNCPSYGISMAIGYCGCGHVRNDRDVSLSIILKYDGYGIGNIIAKAYRIYSIIKKEDAWGSDDKTNKALEHFNFGNAANRFIISSSKTDYPIGEKI